MTVFFNVCCFFFRCNAHAVWHPLVTDDRHVRWHQSGGDLRLVTPLSTPPVSTTHDTASDRDGPRYHTASAIIDIIVNKPIDQKVVELSSSQRYSLVENSMYHSVFLLKAYKM